MFNSAHYLSNTTSTPSAPSSSPSPSSSFSSAPSAYNPFSDHTQRIGNFIDFVSMPHPKSKLHQLELDLSQRQRPSIKKESSSKSNRRSRSPMREAILKGQFLD